MNWLVGHHRDVVGDSHIRMGWPFIIAQAPPTARVPLMTCPGKIWGVTQQDIHTIADFDMLPGLVWLPSLQGSNTTASERGSRCIWQVRAIKPEDERSGDILLGCLSVRLGDEDYEREGLDVAAQLVARRGFSWSWALTLDEWRLLQEACREFISPFASRWMVRKVE